MLGHLFARLNTIWMLKSKIDRTFVVRIANQSTARGCCFRRIFVLCCLLVRSPDRTVSKADGWQYAPMHMIFDVKQEDLRYKVRLVGGSCCGFVYSHNLLVHDLRYLCPILFLIAAQNHLELMVGDVRNAFSTAPCAEKFGQQLDLNSIISGRKVPRSYLNAIIRTTDLKQREDLYLNFWG